MNKNKVRQLNTYSQKRSGYGRDHYVNGIREFVNEKTIKIEQI